MKRNVIFLMLTLWMWSAASVNAQVTIGSDQDPHGGAVLDLSKASGGHIGFLLPRIALQKVGDWSIGGEKATGAGMMVYNTNEAVEGGDGSGIYVWDGIAWSPVKSSADCPRSVTDSEGHTYLATKFGAAGCWVTQNLRSTYNDVIESGSLTEGNKPGDNYALKYYYYPSNSKDIFSAHPEYGLLYTWAAASGRDATDTNEANSLSQTQYQGICPKGWHLPSDYEWNQLEKEIANSTQGTYGTSATTTWSDTWATTTNAHRPSSENDHGKVMKSTTRVKTADGTDVSTDPAGTSKTSNKGGFDAFLVGYVNGGGTAGDYGAITSFWSSSSINSSAAWRRILHTGITGVGRYDDNKGTLIAVRCKKNDN
jgi:uncharacterized protein (TIGR02145 family)